MRWTPQASPRRRRALLGVQIEARCSNGSSSTSPPTSTASAGWRPTAASSCSSPASTSRCSPRCPGRTGSSRSAGCTRRCSRRFGVDARGLWLTERVWEPELAADLADAGVRYALVDDRHFLVTGFAADQLHAPFWTESDGKRVALFPHRRAAPLPDPVPPAGGDRRLPAGAPRRRPPARGAGRRRREVRRLARHQGVGLRQGLAGPLHGHDRRAGRRAARCMLSRLDDALDAVPSGGLAYLPTASYREMEGWSLPPDAALRLDPAGARPRRGARGRPRRRAAPRRALAQLPGQVLRSPTGCTRRCWR